MGHQRRRPAAATTNKNQSKMPNNDDDVTTPLIPKPQQSQSKPYSQWVFFAVASGACAAFNGVFAKLTTTKLTTSLSDAIANFLGLEVKGNNYIEFLIRGTFFILNLIFNGVMWSLFTTALSRGTSTVQVSIMNTSTNFIVTALLGFAIFSEALPPMWWAGAVLLVAGSVITGRKDETTKVKGDGESDNGYDQEES